jgi:hypothetical protein
MTDWFCGEKHLKTVNNNTSTGVKATESKKKKQLTEWYTPKKKKFRTTIGSVMTTTERINALEKELSKLRSELNEPYIIKFEKNNTYLIGVYEIIRSVNGSQFSNINNGRYRKTKQGAELSFERNRKTNRLEMLVESLGGLKEFEVGENNWYIAYSIYNKEWEIYNNTAVDLLTVYITTKEIAQEVCDILNNKRYKL